MATVVARCIVSLGSRIRPSTQIGRLSFRRERNPLRFNTNWSDPHVRASALACCRGLDTVACGGSGACRACPHSYVTRKRSQSHLCLSAQTGPARESRVKVCPRRPRMEENKPAHTTENSGWIEVNCRGGVYFLKKNPKKRTLPSISTLKPEGENRLGQVTPWRPTY